MNVLSQVPTELALIGTAGSPFVATINVESLLDSNGDTIAWSEITNATVYVISSITEMTAFEVTPTSGEAYQWTLAWTAGQTAAMGQYMPWTQGRLSWSLSCTVAGSGPYALCGGELAMYPSTTPGSSTVNSTTLAVSVGTGTASLSVLLGSVGSGGTEPVPNVQTVSGTSYVVPAPSPPLYLLHYLTLSETGTTIELPAAIAGYQLTTYIVQPSGGGCAYSFSDPGSDSETPASETLTTNAIDRYDWECLVAGTWLGVQWLAFTDL